MFFKRTRHGTPSREEIERASAEHYGKDRDAGLSSKLDSTNRFLRDLISEQREFHREVRHFMSKTEDALARAEASLSAVKAKNDELIQFAKDQSQALRDMAAGNGTDDAVAARLTAIADGMDAIVSGDQAELDADGKPKTPPEGGEGDQTQG